MSFIGDRQRIVNRPDKRFESATLKDMVGRNLIKIALACILYALKWLQVLGKTRANWRRIG